MCNLNDYLGRVHAVVNSSSHVLSETELAEIEHLIEHDEPAEALRALAWIIVEGNKKVPCGVISGILVLSKGLVDPTHMPPDLDSHVAEN